MIKKDGLFSLVFRLILSLSSRKISKKLLFSLFFIHRYLFYDLNHKPMIRHRSEPHAINCRCFHINYNNNMPRPYQITTQTCKISYCIFFCIKVQYYLESPPIRNDFYLLSEQFS